MRFPLANLTTGNDGWDLAFLVLATLVGGAGTAKGGHWFVRFLSSLREAIKEVRSFSIRLKAIEDKQIADYADIRKRQTDHEETDAINAMIYMGFVEVSEDAVLVADEKGNTIMVSPVLARMIGLSMEEAVNGAWKDVIHPEDRQTTLIKWEAFVTGALAHLSLRFRFQTQSGRIIPVVMKLIRKKLGQGAVFRVVGLVWRQGEEPKPPPETKQA